MPCAWYRGRRLVTIDGTTVDLPDTPELETRFGCPPASRGSSAFSRLRRLTLVETGTHAIPAAAFGRYTVSEHRLAPALLGSLAAGMPCSADRGLLGFALWRMAAANRVTEKAEPVC